MHCTTYIGNGPNGWEQLCKGFDVFSYRRWWAKRIEIDKVLTPANVVWC